MGRQICVKLAHVTMTVVTPWRITCVVWTCMGRGLGHVEHGGLMSTMPN